MRSQQLINREVKKNRGKKWKKGKREKKPKKKEKGEKKSELTFFGLKRDLKKGLENQLSFNRTVTILLA